MTPARDMTVRMAVDFHQQDLRLQLQELIRLGEKETAILQDLVQYAQELPDELISEQFHAVIDDAKTSILDAEEALERAKAALARGVQ